MVESVSLLSCSPSRAAGSNPVPAVSVSVYGWNPFEEERKKRKKRANRYEKDGEDKRIKRIGDWGIV